MRGTDTKHRALWGEFYDCRQETITSRTALLAYVARDSGAVASGRHCVEVFTPSEMCAGTRNVKFESIINIRFCDIKQKGDFFISVAEEDLLWHDTMTMSVRHQFVTMQQKALLGLEVLICLHILLDM
jgi:hypothetical protein